MRQLDHINLKVPNMEECIKYYEEKLGFKTIGDFLGNRRFVYISDGVTTYEIIEDDTLLTSYIDHIAYVSNDIETDYKYYKNLQVDIVVPLSTIDFLWDNGVSFFLFKTPTGEVIEIIQKL